jgi:hypothetical protein
VLRVTQDLQSLDFSHQNDNLTNISVTSSIIMTQSSQHLSKITLFQNVLSFFLRFSSFGLCIATLTIGIYLESTKDGITNRGGPIPLTYIALASFLLLDVLEMVALLPFRLLDWRIPPPVLAFSDLLAIVFGAFGAAFDSWRYMCMDCFEANESYSTPRLWNQDKILIMTVL